MLIPPPMSNLLMDFSYKIIVIYKFPVYPLFIRLYWIILYNDGRETCI